MKKTYPDIQKNKGSLLIQVLVFGTIAVVMIGALVSWAGVNIKASRYELSREQAFQIAEAGIEYYRWHLAHAPADYYDGNAATSTGPYAHNFYDKDGTLLGAFSLTITPPRTGSTIVTVQSNGTVLSDATVVRKIKVQLGVPSLAKYSEVTNSVVYYGSGDKVYGPIHSNVGIGFWAGSPQPIAYNLVTSAASTTIDKFPCGGGNATTTHFGVYTCVPSADPLPPAAVPSRPDVFAGGRQFPVPAVDFTSITADLSTIKADAIASGFYRAASGANGYKIVLKTNGTFDLYKINTLMSAPGGCTNSQNESGWGMWSISAAGGSTTLLGTYPFPANGLLFFEDNIWVEGQVNNTRLTIAAGAFPVNPATYKNITVNNNLLYTNFDGSDAIGLIAQGTFHIGYASANNLTIDGALIAQNGGTVRNYYSSSCGASYLRSTLTTYGMFGSSGQGYFYWGSSGYQNQPASYDTNFLYGPPPSFPLTGNQYQTISWKEVF